MTRTATPTPQLINLGSTANDGHGTTLRDGGGIINTNFTDLYTAVNSIVDYTLPNASGSVLGGIKVDNVTVSINGSGVLSTISPVPLPASVAPLVDGVAAVGISTTYARADHVHPVASATAPIPSGVIVMWSGASTSIPTGWVLCNGSNGTPDLRDRFVIGAGLSYFVNQVGGNANSSVIAHSHTLGSATFTGAALPPHTHTDSGHTHTYNEWRGSTGGSQPSALGSGSNSAGKTVTDVGVASISTVSAGTPAGTIGGSTDTTGSNGTNANLPPYFALAYIMKS